MVDGGDGGDGGHGDDGDGGDECLPRAMLREHNTCESTHAGAGQHIATQRLTFTRRRETKLRHA